MNNRWRKIINLKQQEPQYEDGDISITIKYDSTQNQTYVSTWNPETKHYNPKQLISIKYHKLLTKTGTYIIQIPPIISNRKKES